MLSDSFCNRISDDWLWRESELRAVDARLLKANATADVKSGILIVYSHWEGHFKTCASELLEFMAEGIKKKIFSWTDFQPEIRNRLLFCNYRKSSIYHQSHETFISYLDALNDKRYSDILRARDEIILIDDNLNTAKAEAICRNLGVDTSWFSLKKIILDERLVEYRNTIAHGARRLRSGDEMDLTRDSITTTLGEVRSLIRESRSRFQNAISSKDFLGN